MSVKQMGLDELGEVAGKASPGKWEWRFLEDGKALLQTRYAETGPPIELNEVNMVMMPGSIGETIVFHKGSETCFWLEESANTRFMETFDPEMVRKLLQVVRMAKETVDAYGDMEDDDNHVGLYEAVNSLSAAVGLVAQ